MRKIVIFANDELQIEQFKSGPVGERYRKIEEQFDAKIEFLVDTSLPSNDKPELKPTHRIEMEGPEWAVHDDHTLEVVKDAEVILVGFHAVNEQLLDAAKKLKLLGALRSGWENVNVPACHGHNVTAVTCPGRNSEPVADYAVAMMMAFNRNIARDDISKRPGWKYPDPDHTEIRPVLMGEATIGIIGFGIIGRKVAERLSGFHPRIVAYDPFANAQELKAMGVELLPLNEVMKQSDIITVHSRLLPATKGLIGAEQIACMKPTAIFVNTARGGLVDEEALYEALKSKRIRGAALDVFVEEPLPDNHPLRALDNVILTCHGAGRAGNTFKIVNDIMCDELERYFKGEPLRNAIR